MRIRFLALWGMMLSCSFALTQASEKPSVFLPDSDEEKPVVKDLTPLDLPAAPEVHEEPTSGLFATGEFLLLTPRTSALDFALVDNANDLIPNGNMQSLHYQTRAGLRTTIGYRTKLGWDIGFTYGFFNSTDDFGVTAPTGSLLYPTLTRPGLINQSRSAYAKAQLTLNTYDIVVGRSWDVDEGFRLRVLGGVRLATFKNGLQSTYDGRDADNAFAETKSNFSGAGPMFGTEAEWILGEGFSIIGRANGGLLTGTQRVKLFESNNAGATVYTNFGDRYADVIPFGQLAIGFGYQYNGVFLRFGYEVTQFFSLIDRPVFVDDFAEGKLTRRVANLALDGLFLQAGFRY